MENMLIKNYYLNFKDNIYLLSFLLNYLLFFTNIFILYKLTHFYNLFYILYNKYKKNNKKCIKLFHKLNKNKLDISNLHDRIEQLLNDNDELNYNDELNNNDDLNYNDILNNNDELNYNDELENTYYQNYFINNDVPFINNTIKHNFISVK